jgi:DNA-binding NarL/FixJ family response regulator
MIPRPRVLLADDHRLFAEGLGSLLADEFELVGVVEDGLALVEAALRLRPDLIVADISMPQLNGLDAMEQLRRDLPEVRVVFVTMHADAAYARRAMEAGAMGYVLKQSAATELLQALHAALDGQRYVTPSCADALLRSMQGGAAATALPTPRQREVLQLLAQGLSVKQIAARLDISARTVEFHKYTLMESIGAKSLAELIRYAARHGIVID